MLKKIQKFIYEYLNEMQENVQQIYKDYLWKKRYDIVFTNNEKEIFV